MVRWLAGWAVAIMLAMGLGASATAADNPASAATAEKLRQILQLLNEPDVKSFMAEHKAPPVPAETRPHHDTMARSLGDELDDVRGHIRDLAASAPHLPEEFDHARAMLADTLGQREVFYIVLYMAAFVGLGFLGNWLFARFTLRFRRWLLGLSLATARERVWAVLARLAYGIGIVASFALGSIGAFLIFDWPVLLKEILHGYLIAFLFVRLSFVVGRFLFAPGAERFRVLPMSTAAAFFIYRRLGLAVSLVAFGWETINVLGVFGFSEPSRDLSRYAVGIVVLIIALESVWRYPAAHNAETAADPLVNKHREDRRSRRFAVKTGLSVLAVVLFFLWVAQALSTFWLLAFAVGLPTTIVLTKRAIRHVLRAEDGTSLDDAHRLELILIERCVRSVIVVLAALLLGRLLEIDFVSLTMQDTVGTRVLRGLVSVTVIVLVADLLWHLTTALIDRKLAGNLGSHSLAEASSHAARLQTLLPILKNVLLAVIAVMAVIMVLGAIGVEIGPLVASAGVLGVAIGFGAQTLVKDIISGIFYLVDDAFRIGEYIQSGSFKGTVESFSLRSVKLRHQRGALYTVPFGVLGAVQNQSRDWVVDKITLNVPYDTDLEKVRKLVKRIDEALAEDPELGPEIIKPLKLQGVAQFGDYAIQIQTKMMTKPGDVQFMARRRALVMIKQSFEANGIGFALPMVHVAGEGANGAAAQKGLQLVQGGKINEAV